MRLKRKYRNLLLLILTVLIVIWLAGLGIQHHNTAVQARTQSSIRTAQQKQRAAASAKRVQAQKQAAKKQRAINWRAPSEKKPYPDVAKYPHIWVRVDIAKQRVYLRSGHKLLYTMYCSTGSDASPTPTGTYYIQGERGAHFYNQSSGEGANYWVSWKNHGEYLFHSVPVSKSGHYIVKEARHLGKKANSHGCVRLSVSDAKWMFRNIPYGTKVVVR
ncbi:L,D-transpeptidase [Lacticaseibacillus zhaodongensis]|uniref:L,D-transpeptidase n=1 Tax=Lacticaseibacillus zhaodongensis TaxID=2668065 RepID=UPI001E2DF9F3|nr:L,D-transpeptidase [Lacticaseibacillus zhaodongensis]